MKTKIAASLIILAAAAPSAGAQIHEPFSLRAARQTTIRHERSQWGSKAHVGACRWTSAAHRRATCAVTIGPIAVIDGQAPATYAATDIVTRQGDCSLPLTTRTSATSGTSVGTDAHWHGCFHGPLVVFAAPGSLRLI